MSSVDSSEHVTWLLLLSSNIEYCYKIRFCSLFTSKLDLNLRKEMVKCFIWSVGLYGAVAWTMRKVDQKYLEDF